MARYVRIFCQSSAVPPLRRVFESAAKGGHRLMLDPAFARVDLDSTDWEQVGIIYKEGKSAFWSEINKEQGPDEALFREEVKQFEELLAETEDSPEARRVLEHIRHTRYIIAIELPADFDEDGSLALSSYLAYFINCCGGMVQADDEGFYDGDRLIVRLE